MASAVINPTRKKVALIMGVANNRSIAWATVESFLRTNNYDCILTFQSERFRDKVDKMVLSANARHWMAQNNQNNQNNHNNHNNDKDNNHTGTSILASLPCNVQTDLPALFHDVLPFHLEQGDRKIDAIVHSLAYANFEGHADKLSLASWQAFSEAQHISAYSFLETARCATESNLLLHSNTNPHTDTVRTLHSDSNAHSHSVVSPSSSLTALSYIGAARSVPGYHIMGPAKASLEAIVRGLAAELGTNTHPASTHTHSPAAAAAAGTIRVNCVSAGPVQTAAARGIPGFSKLAAAADATAPTGNPAVDQVANVVTWVADSAATGVTGQTIYVDGGYSTTVSVPSE